jgi:hypothetical protein
MQAGNFSKYGSRIAQSVEPRYGISRVPGSSPGQSAHFFHPVTFGAQWGTVTGLISEFNLHYSRTNFNIAGDFIMLQNYSLLEEKMCKRPDSSVRVPVRLHNVLTLWHLVYIHFHWDDETVEKSYPYHCIIISVICLFIHHDHHHNYYH